MTELLPVNWSWHLRPIGFRSFAPKDHSRSSSLMILPEDRQVLAADSEASRRNTGTLLGKGNGYQLFAVSEETLMGNLRGDQYNVRIKKVETA